MSTSQSHGRFLAREESAAVSRDEVYLHASRVLVSDVFRHAERLSRFLRYVVELAVEGRSDEIKEYSIGVEVFDRDASFDPRIDPIVRGEARRLRTKLRDYYESEGASERLRIEIPKGSYVPVFVPSGNGRSTEDRLETVAVLPFTNLTPGEENEYFADGLSEDLINILASVPNLRVTSRTSAFAFKGKQVDVRSIGERLKVDAVVEGSVRRNGSQLRISAQLIKVSDDYQLWSGRYDRVMEDIFHVQEEIARSIVGALKIHLEGNGAPAVRRTRNIDAYHHYLQARHCWNQQSPIGLEHAIRFYRRTLEEDCEYAPAWGGLSDCHRLLGFWGHAAPADTWSQARQAAQRALELDALGGEAHAAAGGLAAAVDWEWATAERHFRRAIELSPGYVDAYQSYAVLYLIPQRRFEEALEAMETSLKLDPISPFVWSLAAWACHVAGRYGEAEEYFGQALELDSRFFLAHLSVGMLYEQLGRLPEAMDHLRESCLHSGWVPLPTAKYAFSLAHTGDHNEARRMLKELEERSQARYVSQYDLAAIYGALGDRDRCYALLLEAVEEHAGRLIWLGVDPRFRDLRGEERFANILRRIGLPAV